MFKELPFMMTLQIGLIGIVVVAGFYLIWKALTRIEEKVDLMLLDKQSQQFFPMEESKASHSPSQDAMMNAIFSEDIPEEGFMIFSSPFQMPEEEEPMEPPHVEIEEMKPEAVEPSEITITHLGFSKTKLKTMNVDKLKDLCQERHLSTEGTKNQLIERLLEGSA